MLHLNYPQSSYELQESAQKTKASLLRPAQLNWAVVITQLKSLGWSLGALHYSLRIKKNESLSESVCATICIWPGCHCWLCHRPTG